jgi:(p)ppGpp synthase/HD superfamily hydrolase
VERDYPDAEVGAIRAAYDLAMQLFTSRYRGSGKPFLAHAVGTAGILTLLRAPAHVVAAGLLHAAYTHGDFGDGRAGISAVKRAEVRGVVGNDTEVLIARYTEWAWNETAVLALRGRITSLRPDDRTVLLMRLANELEDHLDLGIAYCRDAEHRRGLIRSWLHTCVDLAEELGQPDLAGWLARAFRGNLSALVPRELMADQSISYTLTPASYRPRLLVRLRRLLARRG